MFFQFLEHCLPDVLSSYLQGGFPPGAPGTLSDVCVCVNGPHLQWAVLWVSVRYNNRIKRTETYTGAIKNYKYKKTKSRDSMR